MIIFVKTIKAWRTLEHFETYFHWGCTGNSLNPQEYRELYYCIQEVRRVQVSTSYWHSWWSTPDFPSAASIIQRSRLWTRPAVERNWIFLTFQQPSLMSMIHEIKSSQSWHFARSRCNGRQNNVTAARIVFALEVLDLFDIH